MRIKFDCEELLKKFDFLKQDKGPLRQKITRAILQPLKNQVRTNVRKTLKRKTGRTAHNTDIWAFKDGTGRLFLGTFYGRLMESDHYIGAKEKKFLKFKIGAKWFTKKDSIFVKKRDLVASIWKNGTAPAVMVAAAEKILTQELEKWRKK
ncbi:hypothetical protein [Treponema lecithinolyticum]